MVWYKEVRQSRRPQDGRSKPSLAENMLDVVEKDANDRIEGKACRGIKIAEAVGRPQPTGKDLESSREKKETRRAGKRVEKKQSKRKWKLTAEDKRRMRNEGIAKKVVERKSGKCDSEKTYDSG